jgi:hypothetical protein
LTITRSAVSAAVASARGGWLLTPPSDEVSQLSAEHSTR